MDTAKRKAEIAAALLALEERGRITPECVVSEARSESSPLHSCFEWDDTKAAEHYRIEQARVLIRSVTVTVETQERRLTVVRYVRDPQAGSEEQGYVSVDALRENREEVLILLRYEVARAEAIFERARALVEALQAEGGAEVSAQFEKADRSLKRLSKKVRMMQPET